MHFHIEYEQEADGRWLAEAMKLSGALAYGRTGEEATAQAEVLALKTLARPGWPDAIFAFHGQEEIGPRMPARLAKHTGLNSEGL
ncbi:MAG: hypothetical protein ACYCZC_05075 [Acidithiobacillus sp.]